MDGVIVVGGQYVSVPGVECRTFLETGLQFRPPRGCVVRHLPVDTVVVHNTAAENAPDRVFANLSNRKNKAGKPAPLSVHFVIGKDGAVWQFADPLTTTCFHAGECNGSSVGIELVNRVTAPLGTLHYWAAKLGRPIVREDYRGKTRTVLGHTPAQKRSLSAVVLALLDAIPSIPAQLPWHGTGTKVSAMRVSPDYTGVCSHLHVTDAHRDPCQDVYEELSPRLRALSAPPKEAA